MYRELDKFLGFRRKGTGASIAQLVDLTNLLAYYKLDELSGQRNDESSNALHLADVNTVTQETGKINTCAKFTLVNNEGLRHISNLYHLSTDKTFFGWFYLDDKLLTQTLFSKWNPTDSSAEYKLEYNVVSDRFVWSKSTLEDITASTFGAPSAGTFYFIVCTYNNTDKKFRVSVNNGAFNVGANTDNPVNDDSFFYLGRLAEIVSLPLNGRVDEFGIFNRLLTSGEITALYNSGNGLAYPFQA